MGEKERIVVDKADRSCREGWSWRASSNRVCNEERQRRRRQQRRHPLYSHRGRVYTTRAYTCRDARSLSYLPPHSLSLSLSLGHYPSLVLCLSLSILTVLSSRGLSNHISLYVILLSGAVSPFHPFLFFSPRRTSPVSLAYTLLSVTMLPRRMHAAASSPTVCSISLSLRLCTQGRIMRRVQPVMRLADPSPPLSLSLSRFAARART